LYTTQQPHRRTRNKPLLEPIHPSLYLGIQQQNHLYFVEQQENKEAHEKGGLLAYLLGWLLRLRFIWL
jgi:hypothetical protein